MIRQFIDLFGALVMVVCPVAVICYYANVPAVITSMICSALAAIIGVAIAEDHGDL